MVKHWLTGLTLLFLLSTKAFSATFSSWQSSHFTIAQLADAAISGENSDPDKDGIINLLEYAYAGEPLISNKDIRPFASLTTNHLKLTYRQILNSEDLVFSLQASNDLSSWQTQTDFSVAIDSSFTDYKVVSLTDPQNFNGLSKRFLRLKVVRSPVMPNPLMPPTNLIASLSSPIGVQLSWTDNASGESGFRIERKNNNGSFEVIGGVGANLSVYLDRAVNGTTSYNYRVIAVNSTAQSAYSNDAAITTLLDSDGDGLSDLAEIQIFLTNPNNYDTDNDGLPDGIEVSTSGLNPLNYNDPDGDLDGDGVSNSNEVKNNTKANAGDTDGDGVDDATEINQGSDANDFTDLGQSPPPEDLVTLFLNLTEQTSPYTQTYKMTVGPVTVISKQGFGGVGYFVFRRGRSYPITISRIGSTQTLPGNDYTANIIDFQKQYILLDDSNQILGTHASNGNNFPADGQQATLHIPKLALITPGGSPSSSPNDNQGSDGQNEFTYTSANPGVLTIEIKAKVTPANLANRIKNNVTFDAPAIGNSTKTFSAITVDGDNLKQTFTFTGLPANYYDFGSKYASVSLIESGSDDIADSFDYKEYEVFYPGKSNNHPVTDPTPNWFYYYKQNTGGGAFGYQSGGLRSASASAGGDSTIKIGDEAYDGDEYIVTSLSSGFLKATGWSTTKRYYANFVGVVAHERQHANGEVTQGGPTDPDFDWLASNLETATSRTKPNDPLSASSGFSGTPGFTDDEIYAGGPVEENAQKTADATQDWAEPGTNHK